MLVSTWLNGGRDVAWVGVERDETDPIRFWAAVMDALRASGALAEDDPLATLTPGAGGRAGRVPRAPARRARPAAARGPARARRPARAALGRGPPGRRAVARRRARPAADDRDQPPRAEARPAPPAPRRRPARAARRRPALHRRRGGRAAGRGGRRGRCRATSAVCTSAPRAGRPGCGWRRMSLARHDAPARFVAEFSGSERTVADYLLDEVLASQPPEVRSLLLRTCILERVNGPLADLLTGRGDGARLLHELEEANAFVVAVDVARTWFRYHHLLADLLRLELQREAPETVVELHRLAAGWHAEHGHAVEAIRHAAHGRDWELAGELLGRHWVHLLLDGEEPDARRAARRAAGGADRRRRRARHHRRGGHARRGPLGRGRCPHRCGAGGAAGAAGGPPAPRRDRARQRGAAARAPGRRPGRRARGGDARSCTARARPAGVELEAFALMNLGIAERWTLRLAEAETHLERGARARRAGSGGPTWSSAASRRSAPSATSPAAFDAAEAPPARGDRGSRSGWAGPRCRWWA